MGWMGGLKKWRLAGEVSSRKASRISRVVAVLSLFLRVQLGTKKCWRTARCQMIGSLAFMPMPGDVALNYVECGGAVIH